MKLYDKEATVLAAVVESNSINIEKLSKLTKLKYHIVRYNLSLLEEKKIIGRSIMFNPSLLGFQVINIFFTVPFSQKQKVLKYLKSHSIVAWLAENSGDVPYELTCHVQHIGEVEKLKQEISNRFDINMAHQEWAAEIELIFLGYKYLIGPKASIDPITVHWGNTRIPYDLIDLNIISTLRSYSYKNESDVAKFLKIPNATLLYRIKRLKASGIIVSDFIHIDHLALGILEVQILLVLSNLDADKIKKFRAFVYKHPAVIALIRCFGSWDYKLVVHVKSHQELFELQDNLRILFPELIKTLRAIPRRQLYQLGPVCVLPQNQIMAK